MSTVGAFARRIREGPWFWAVMAINAGGILYGFFYYARQFAATPMWLWPLVPDSPMAVLLLTIALLAARFRTCPPWLALLGAVTMVQVGVWTAIVLPLYAGHFGFDLLDYSIQWMGMTPGGPGLNSWLWWLHLAMAAEAVLVADLLPRRWGTYAGLGALMMLHTVLDHTWPISYPWRTGCQGLFPHTVPCDRQGLLFGITLALWPAALLALRGSRALAATGGTERSAGEDHPSPMSSRR